LARGSKKPPHSKGDAKMKTLLILALTGLVAMGAFKVTESSFVASVNMHNIALAEAE